MYICTSKNPHTLTFLWQSILSENKHKCQPDAEISNKELLEVEQWGYKGFILQDYWEERKSEINVCLYYLKICIASKTAEFQKGCSVFETVICRSHVNKMCCLEFQQRIKKAFAGQTWLLCSGL